MCERTVAAGLQRQYPKMTLPYLLVWLCPAALLMAYALTAAMRRYALRANLMDRPNERSSHTVPTPRGGGVAIVFTVLLGLIVLVALGRVPDDLAVGLGVGGAVIALLGFVDDRQGLPARWRFLGHALCGVWLAMQLGPVPPVTVFGFLVPLGWVGEALALVYLVWSINLYNFMDGIDGIASIQVITVSLGGALLAWMVGLPEALPVAFLLAAAALGFLAWNFPKARIFMGDAGSGFLGFAMGALALWYGHRWPHLFWCWFILNGSFMVDATTTLVRRVRRGERFHVAHRSHAYQYAARLAGSHVPVTLAVAAINILWLLPVAAAVATRHLDGVSGVLIAYLPLTWLAFRFKAGDRAAQGG